MFINTVYLALCTCRLFDKIIVNSMMRSLLILLNHRCCFEHVSIMICSTPITENISLSAVVLVPIQAKF